MKRLIRIGAPLGILMLAVAAYAVMQQSVVKPDIRTPEPSLPTAPYIEAQAQTITLTVHSQGTVQPCIQTTLTAEVSGTIRRAAPAFHTGEMFEAGALLLEIDPRDYEEMVIQAEAALAGAQLNLATEKARAAQAAQDWKALSSDTPSALALRRPQLKQAQAAVRAAQADLNRARRDLSKTRICAPYAMMVNSKLVDAGQYVTSGTPLAQIFSIQAAEIRLPVTAEELTQLGLSIRRSDRSDVQSMPPVRFNAAIGDRTVSWHGRVVRTEGLFDPKTRVIHVVARVEDPYGFLKPRHASPLAMGMFVEAQIRGTTIRDRIVLPSSTLVEGRSVWVIHEDETLQLRNVGLAHVSAGQVVVERGVLPGERIFLNPVDVVTDGMRVKAVPADTAMGADQEVSR